MQDRLNFRKSLMIAALGMIALLQGCGSKVDCNDSKAKKDAVEIIQSHLNNAVWYRQMNAALSGTPELSSIKTLAHSDELKQSECSGKYSVTYNGKPREIEFNYSLAYLQDRGETEVKVAVNSVASGLIGIVMAEPPIKNGVEKILDSKTGNLEHKIQWKNGVQDGLDEIYNPATNKLIGQINFINGQKNGSEKHWDATGEKLLIDLNWKDGKATGFEKHWDATGEKLLIDLNWKDGKATGFKTTGFLTTNYDEYHIKDGLFNGVHKKYLAKSNTTSDMFLLIMDNYKEGKLDGISQEFSDAGNVIEEKNYKEGVEIPVNPHAQAITTADVTQPAEPGVRHRLGGLL